MNAMVFIEEKNSTMYKSILFPLFHNDFSSRICLSSSFLSYNKHVFPIFTLVNSYIINWTKKNNIEKYGLILDISKGISEEIISFIINASFVFFIGNISDSNTEKIISNKNNSCHIERIVFDPIKDGQPQILNSALVDFDSLGILYEEFVQNNYNIDTLYVLGSDLTKDVNFVEKKFASIGVKIIYQVPVPVQYQYFLTHATKYFYHDDLLCSNLSHDKNILSVSSLADKVSSFIDEYTNVLNETQYPPKINIICFNPTYLFKDLVKRFEGKGCIHSDLPMPDADAYIWMRPQELWHYDYLLRGIPDQEIKVSYQNAFHKSTSRVSMDYIRTRSVAIHHGTCFEPIYQFCPYKLARILRDIYSVVGVCEFEECYGPSADIANKDNYSFVPIGYDNTLFTKEFISKIPKVKQSPLQIGFVGRAYGTDNQQQLQASRLSEPYGYRKGGDFLLDLLLNLQSSNINFSLHILGSNWEALVDKLEQYGISYTYYTRDTNITYTEYPKIYSKFDMLCITARCEGGPVSAIEALSLGVKVVSTDVGVCKYLYNILCGQKSMYIYRYYRKWNTFDINAAIKYITDIYNSEVTFEEREQIHSSVSQFTTQSWVDSICEKAEEAVKNAL